MGQFYRTSKPQFVEDFMYQPPWELAKEVILAQDKKINDQLAMAGKLEEVLNFNTLDFDKEKATEKKLQYTNEIQQITDLIKKDPENYSKYSDQLRKLQQTLSSDYTSGDIASMIGSYNSAQAFIKDHEKFKEKEAARYNAAYNSFYNNAKTKRETDGYKGDGSSVWQSEQIMESIDFTKGFVDYVTKLQPDVIASSSAGSNGKYIFKNKSSNKTLSKEQVRSLMTSYVENTPNIREYLDQTEKIGLEDPTKNLLEFADNFSYSQKTSDASQSVDSYGLAATQNAYAEKRAATSFANQKALIDYREQVKNKGVIGGGTHVGAAKLILGNTAMKAANFKAEDAINYGTGALVGNGILKPADGAKLQSYINNTFKDVKSFGSNKINFVFQKDFVNPKTKRSYKAGQSLTMTVQQAKNSGFIKDVVPNSGNPFYFDNENNGVNFKFTSPTANEDNESDAIVGNLLPPGSINGQVDVGYRIFNLE